MSAGVDTILQGLIDSAPGTAYAIAGVAGLGGLALAGAAGARLWKVVQEEGQVPFGPAAAFFAASMLAIVGVIVGWSSNLLFPS